MATRYIRLIGMAAMKCNKMMERLIVMTVSMLWAVVMLEVMIASMVQVMLK